MPSVRIQFDKEAAFKGIKGVIGRIKYAVSSPEVKKEISGAYAQIVSQYVPYKKGKLRRSARVVPNGKDFAVRYSARSKKGYDYADVQYQPEKYGKDESQWNRTTPNTYSHWNRHLTAADREWFKNEANRILREGINHGR